MMGLHGRSRIKPYCERYITLRNSLLVSSTSFRVLHADASRPMLVGHVDVCLLIGSLALTVLTNGLKFSKYDCLAPPSGTHSEFGSKTGTGRAS